MNRFSLIGISALVAAAGSATAQTAYDQNVTSNVIFGSGNDNGSFTTNTNSGLELGLRGKLRFNAVNAPENTFNSNGDGSYTFEAGLPPTGFGWAPGSTSTAVWNFEWSINTDTTDSTGKYIGDYTYEIGMDVDPTAGTNFLAFDPVTVTSPDYWDHSFGDNSTTSANDFVAGDNATYAGYLASKNLAQNSWNYEFFKTVGVMPSFDPTVVGDYEIYLAAFDATGEVGRSTIHINVVPSPGSAALLGFGGLVAVRRRR